MSELIKISDHDGKKAVSARELHTFLESKQQFTNWINNRIKKYGFIENQDYIVFNSFIKNPEGGRPLDEYVLTLDCAKELSMVEGNAKGKEARKYFIECEKQLKKPLSQLDILAQSVEILQQHENRLDNVEQKINELDAKQVTRPNYFAIAGYAALIKRTISLKQASELGRKAAKLCKERGFEIQKINDPRFGLIGAYPYEVLKEVFDTAQPEPFPKQ